MLSPFSYQYRFKSASNTPHTMLNKPNILVNLTRVLNVSDDHNQISGDRHKVSLQKEYEIAQMTNMILNSVFDCK